MRNTKNKKTGAANTDPFNKAHASKIQRMPTRGLSIPSVSFSILTNARYVHNGKFK